MTDLRQRLTELRERWHAEWITLDEDPDTLLRELNRLNAIIEHIDELLAGDDGAEPVSDEWLEQTVGEDRQLRLGNGFDVWFHDDGAVQLAADGGAYVKYLRSVKTRRDVRELCRVLGKPIGGAE